MASKKQENIWTKLSASFHSRAVLLLMLTWMDKKSHGIPTGPHPDLSGSLLPLPWPSGDPSLYALPIFLQQPESAFAARGAPAVLTCRAAHALSAHFVCNDEEMEESSAVTRRSGLVGDSVGYKEVVLNVRRGDVLDVLGNYSCRCHAVSSKGEVVSKEVIVRAAYLRRDFDTPPYSQRLSLGGQGILRCHPPQGDPPARVTHWLKNGVKVDPSLDNNFIQNSDGDLLLQQARMEDMANYTCVAANPAQERISPPATITVFVPGAWGEWSHWSPCNAQCGRGLRMRTRQCDSPSPINGGPPCDGEAVRKETCSNACPPVDGAWAEWNSWSSCSADCVRFRRRRCSSPAPKHGGRYCQQGKDGKEQQSQDCSGGMCRPGLNSIVLYGTEPSPLDPPSGVFTSDLVLCIGLFAAFFVFVIVVVVIVRILRRKDLPISRGCAQTLRHETGGECCHPTDRMNHACYDNIHFDEASNISSRRNEIAPRGIIRPPSEHLYEQPMVVLFPKSPSDSLEKTPFLDHCSSGQPSPTQELLQAPRNSNSHTWCTVTAKGARISCSMSVSLTVPENAISFPQDMFVSLLPLERCRYLMTAANIVSAVVQCGPAGVILLKPVVLSLPMHDRRKTFSVLYCEDLDGVEAKWEVMSDARVQIDDVIVHIVTERLGAFVLVSDMTSTSASTVHSSSSSGCSSLVTSPAKEEPKMSACTRQALCRVLDEGQGWRQMAEALGAEHYSSFFAHQRSPSEALLDLWEASCSREPITSLARLLREIRRDDAADILERDFR